MSEIFSRRVTFYAAIPLGGVLPPRPVGRPDRLRQKRPNKNTLIAGTVLLLAALAALAVADTHYVATNGTHVAPFTNWTDAATNIQDAVNAASDNDTVLVSNGVYVSYGAVTGVSADASNSMIVITKGITLASLNGSSNTLVNGNRTGGVTNRCIYVNHSSAIIDGFTITNGYAVGSALTNYGAGVLIQSAGLVRNCVITGNEGGSSSRGCGVSCYAGGVVSNCQIIGNNNVAGGGAGIGAYVLDGVIDNCVISWNTTGNGNGGLFMQGNAIAKNCTIISNASWDGGGFFLQGGEMSNCVIRGNSAASGGGGLMWGGTITHSTIASNRTTSYSGGGIYLSGGIIQNCVIKTNQAAQYGGGVHFSGGGSSRNTLIIENSARISGGGASFISGGLVENCTITMNTTTNIGGGVYLDTTTNNLSRNSIVYYNTALAGNSNYYNDPAGGADYTNSYTYTCTTPDLGGGIGNITNDPQFKNAAGGDYRLGDNSPCVNTGTNQSWMTNAVDLDGTPRIFRNIVDMGAYEYSFRGTFFYAH